MIGLLKLFQKKKTMSQDIVPNLPSSRQSPKYSPKETITASHGNRLESLKDGHYSADEISPSSYLVDVSGISWDDVIGMEDLKEDLKDVIAFLSPDEEVRQSMEYWGITPQKGMLMFGPPGCGKTLIGKAIASQCNARFYLINGPEIKNKYVGESVKRLKEVYREAKRNPPSIIFIDEIDAIAVTRESSVISETGRDIVTTLLTELDGVKELSGVLTIGATNYPQVIDQALLRPGRLGKGLRVDLPTEEMRLTILKKGFAKKPIGDDVDLNEIARITQGFSGADIVNMINTSALHAMRNNGRKAIGSISMADVKSSLQRTGRSVSTDALADYVRWEKHAFE
jgi:transitional endoplasmic reticulum ATPase